MEMSRIYDVVVVGAGPAGAAAAISAAERGLLVALLEAGRYPRHKVCGEFVSAEAAVVLRHLLRGDDVLLQNAPRIHFSRLHSNGHEVSMPLTDSAYSIPRIALDDCLWKQAIARGIDCQLTEAKSISRHESEFQIATSAATIRARAVVNASGRWSRIMQNDATCVPWIGLKAHFSGVTDDAVDLYFMNDGYCGVQAVAPGVVNACALVKQGTAKTLTEVFQRDPALRTRSSIWTQITETFATAPVFLGLRSPTRDGVLYVGDAAGFVDPFVGDGISLALRTGVLAGRMVLDRLTEEYDRLYRQAFGSVFRASEFVRTALAASHNLRPWLIQAVRVPIVARRIFDATRAARVDVLGPTVPLLGRVN